MPLVVASLLVALATPPVGADEHEPSLSIRPPLAYVGKELRSPIYLGGQGSADLQRLALEIRFPSDLLSFADVEPSFLLRPPAVQIATKTAAEPDGITALFIDITARDGLPEGLVMYVLFRVSASAPLGGQIPLKTRAQSSTSTDAAAALTALRFPEEIMPISPRRQEEEVQFACFFYMH